MYYINEVNGKRMQDRNVIMRLVAVALLLYALLGLATASGKLRQSEGENRALAGELAARRQEQAMLTEKLSGADRDTEMEALARERLGMVRPGDTVFYFISGSD